MDRHLYPVRDETGPEREQPARGPIRVVLAEEHTAMRRTLRQLLEREPDLEIVADAADVQTIVRDARAQQPQVLVLDLSLSYGSNVDAIRLMRERLPNTAIVVVTMDDSPLSARRALGVGAIGFVLKEIADAELPQAVRRAALGGTGVRACVCGEAACGRPRRGLAEWRW